MSENTTDSSSEEQGNGQILHSDPSVETVIVVPTHKQNNNLGWEVYLEIKWQNKTCPELLLNILDRKSLNIKKIKKNH